MILFVLSTMRFFIHYILHRDLPNIKHKEPRKLNANRWAQAMEATRLFPPLSPKTFQGYLLSAILAASDPLSAHVILSIITCPRDTPSPSTSPPREKRT